jgi:hypothetical protein
MSKLSFGHGADAELRFRYGSPTPSSLQREGRVDDLMDENPLSKELEFFEQQLPELLKHHEGKFALIKGDELLGTFDTMEAAYQAGLGKLGNVPMLIRPVVQEQTTHSAPALMHGVIFAHP